jgi:hypothetical protein
MANRDDWLITYRDFSDSELAAEIETLEAQRKNFLTSQGAGSKNFSRDRASINDQYTAAIEVRRDRRSGGPARSGTTDFSALDVN